MVYSFKLMICIAKMSNISCQMSSCSCGDNMVRLSRLDRARALGMVQVGTSHEVVARHFNVNRSTISRLLSAIGILQTSRIGPGVVAPE